MTVLVDNSSHLLGQIQFSSLGQVQPASETKNHQLGGFATHLKSALDEISQMQQTASMKAEAFEQGVQGVSLNEVMVDLQKSSVSLQLGVQVRNKLVASYQEIMNMSV